MADMTTNIKDVSGKFLIASPTLADPNFSQTVVLICEHGPEGGFGLVVNRVLMTSFKPLLPVFEIEKTIVDLPVYFGGPVRPDQGYVIFSPYGGRYGAIRVGERLAVTASKEILFDIARGEGPERFLLTLGFSGWAPNQLEDELMTDSWLIAPLDSRLVFSLPVEDRWKYAAKSIGVDFERFSCKGGSA